MRGLGSQAHAASSIGHCSASMARRPRSRSRSSAARPRYPTVATSVSGWRRNAVSSLLSRASVGADDAPGGLADHRARQCDDLSHHTLKRARVRASDRPEAAPVTQPGLRDVRRGGEAGGERRERGVGQAARALAWIFGDDRAEHRIAAHPVRRFAGARQFLECGQVWQPAQPRERSAPLPAATPRSRRPARASAHAACARFRVRPSGREVSRPGGEARGAADPQQGGQVAACAGTLPNRRPSAATRGVPAAAPVNTRIGRQDRS